jgi:hypothetical protein
MLEVGNLQEVKESAITSRNEAEGFASAAEESASASSKSASESSKSASDSSKSASESENARKEAETFAEKAEIEVGKAQNYLGSANAAAVASKMFSEQAKAQVDLLRDEWNFTLYDDSPEWESGYYARPGKYIVKPIKLSSGKKYYCKINANAEVSNFYLYMMDGNLLLLYKYMTYVDGYYECEFEGFDFEGEMKIGWEPDYGSIIATKITISQMDSMAEVLGNIDKALDRIIAIQDSLIGGEG